MRSTDLININDLGDYKMTSHLIRPNDMNLIGRLRDGPKTRAELINSSGLTKDETIDALARLMQEHLVLQMNSDDNRIVYDLIDTDEPA